MESSVQNASADAVHPADDRLIDRRDACAVFGVSLGTWVTWTRDGRVPRGEIGTTVNGAQGMLYSRAALLKLKAEFDAAAAPSADPDRPGVVRVPVVTRRAVPVFALIDAADLPRIEGMRWNYSPGHSKDPSVFDGTVVRAMTGTPKPSLARVLLGGSDDGLCVVHVNGDRLDCRRENLGLRTRGAIKRATKKVTVKGGRECGSRFKGVSRTTNGRKWTAAIAIDGVAKQLGRFYSEIDAALAYDAAVREHFGPDTPVNLPDPAEAERLREQEPKPDLTWPPPGMITRSEACAMFGVSFKAWQAWEKKGRITCGQSFPRPNDKPGRCKMYPVTALEADRERLEKLGKPYPDPDRPGVYRLPLKSRTAHREVLIDAADLPIVAGRNWNWGPRSDTPGMGVVLLASVKDQTPLHRLIMGATNKEQRVGFANGDPLDCRRANLIVRTPAEISGASRPSAMRRGQAVTSLYKGVCVDVERGRWLAQIRRGGVTLQIGRFETETAAAEAYDDYARTLFGAGAFVNFPDRPAAPAKTVAAREVFDAAFARQRAERRRQRRLEQSLRHATACTNADHSADDGGDVVSADTARLFFDVTTTVWQRWNRFGWVPATRDDHGVSLAAVEQLLRHCGLNVLPYPDPERPGVWRVPLCGESSGGREALIDADAVPLVRTRRWRFAESDSGRGGEVQTMNPAENVRLHHVVTGFTPGDDVRHLSPRNDDPLDCRRENLVERTLTDTAGNRRKQATFNGCPCTSRFKGVWYDARRERWMATIKKDRVQYRLGSFRDEIAAAERYDAAAKELFGEHARPNFPDGIDARLEQETAADLRAAA